MKEAITPTDTLQTPETPNEKMNDHNPRAFTHSGEDRGNNDIQFGHDGDETKHYSPFKNGNSGNSDHNSDKGYHHDGSKKQQTPQWKQQKSLLSPLATLLKDEQNAPSSGGLKNLGIHIYSIILTIYVEG